MSWATILNNLGALVTLGLGIMALVSPSTASDFTKVRPDGLQGVSEIRATYGGLFAALGGLALLVQEPLVFATLGVGWSGAAAGRALSVVVDASRSPTNLGGILFEAAIAALLLV